MPPTGVTSVEYVSGSATSRKCSGISIRVTPREICAVPRMYTSDWGPSSETYWISLLASSGCGCTNDFVVAVKVPWT